MTDVPDEAAGGHLGEAGDPVEGVRDGQDRDVATDGPAPSDHLTGGGDPAEGKR